MPIQGAPPAVGNGPAAGAATAGHHIRYQAPCESLGTTRQVTSGDAVVLNFEAYANLGGGPDHTSIDTNGVPDECEAAIPVVSGWGLAGMTLLTLTAGTFVYMRRRPA